MFEQVEKKLSAASSALIIDKPFLGALVLRMPMIVANPDWCRTTATDARSIYFNPEYINELSFDQTLFVLAHEALHCALLHFARRQHRVKYRWDLACDLAVNPILIKDGLTPPPTAIYLDVYEDMTAEEIYPMLDDMQDMETHDDHLYDDDQSIENSGSGPSQSGDTENASENPTPSQTESQPDPKNEQGSGTVNKQQTAEQQPQGASRPKPLSESEKQELAVQWQQRMAGAAQQAMQAGKLSGAMARLVDDLLQPQLPWRQLLAQYMSASARDDYNYTRPSKREGAAILPSLRSKQVDLVVVLDTSGSISKSEMQFFLSEVNAIKGQVKARITLHACDNHMDQSGPWEYEYWDEFSLPDNISGGGGTSFVPVFDWLATQGRQPDLLIYFTDALGEFPKLEAFFPVIWLVKGKAKVPWGQRIQLN